jgi:glycosyltransferase involved in cell wall biosynthesis
LKYSVIIPAYNSAATLDLAIESAAAQTIPPAEIIVVDDGSTDDTAAVASRHSPLVRLIRQANAGAGAARNTGVRASSGEWIAFLDADDTWLPEKLERQLTMTVDPAVGVIHARGPLARYPAPPYVTFENLWEHNLIMCSSVVVRRTAFEGVGGFDESLKTGCEDHNLWLRLAAAGWKIATCPEDLAHYTPAPGSASQDHERCAQMLFISYRKIGELLKLDPDLVRRKILDLHVAWARGLIYVRNMPAARRLLAVPLIERPSLGVLYLWLATFIPLRLLDLRRHYLEKSSSDVLE